MNRIAPRLAAAFLALATIAFATVAVPTVASAHPGHEGAGFVHGLLHPLSGVDHILAMVAVGLFAARLGGRALWLVPASFVTAMALAGAVGMTGLSLPHVEAGIALSILVLGAAIAFQTTMPVAAAMALVAFFAVFHGYAHGAEMPETAAPLLYGLGLLFGTAVLLLIGIGLGMAARSPTGQRLLPVGAAAIAGVGITLILAL